MRPFIVAVLAIAAVTLATSSAGPAAERRPRLERDDCARRCAACERGCDNKKDMERLSCKTDCRLIESQCRHGRH